jgi:hypothetical protein
MLFSNIGISLLIVLLEGLFTNLVLGYCLVYLPFFPFTYPAFAAAYLACCVLGPNNPSTSLAPLLPLTPL